MYEPAHCITSYDLAVIWVVLAVWMLLDVCVLVVNHSDLLGMMEYLTNQVWVVGVLVRLLLASRLRFLPRHQEELETADWLASVSLVIWGAMQAGVLIAFFYLLGRDSNILDEMMQNQQYTIASIILMLLLSLRSYLTACIVSASGLQFSVHLPRARLAVLALVVPVACGVLHSLIWDDQKLYRYGSANVGNQCQLAFGISAILRGSRWHKNSP